MTDPKYKRKLIFTKGGFGVADVSRQAIRKNLKSLIQILRQGTKYDRQTKKAHNSTR